MLETQKLAEQVAIVTGAAQGIGRGIALVLAGAGARIVIGDIQDASGTVQEIRAAGGQAMCTLADISKPRDDEALVNLALSEYDRLDILVNNAAIDAPDGNACIPPAGGRCSDGVCGSGTGGQGGAGGIGGEAGAGGQSGAGGQGGA